MPLSYLRKSKVNLSGCILRVFWIFCEAVMFSHEMQFDYCPPELYFWLVRKMYAHT